MRKRPKVHARWDIPQNEGSAVAIALSGSTLAQANVASAGVDTALVAPASAGCVLHDGGGREEPEGIAQDDGENGPLGVDEHPGNLSNEQYALDCIPVLVDHVLQQTDEVMETLTYEELARRLGRRNKHGQPAGRGLGVVLGRAMELIDRATSHMDSAPPYLTTVVVAKTGSDKGLPGIGVRERWRGYEQLTRGEKSDRVAREYLLILQFGSRWRDVLTRLGLPSCPVGQGVPPGTDEGAVRGRWGGAESDEHKSLKEYVRTHPSMFGAGGHELGWRATAEYALRSGDEIDVFFRSHGAWIGVEVKSMVSDGNLQDYERGLYQVVKYRAVLLAQAKIDYPTAPPKITVLLALDSELPPALHAVARFLGVQVVENLGLARR
jgi:hypothetical protein